MILQRGGATVYKQENAIDIDEFKLGLQSGNIQFGSKSTIVLAVWPWNLTDDLEKQYDISPMLL